jgi:hypothetical protein
MLQPRYARLSGEANHHLGARPNKCIIIILTTPRKSERKTQNPTGADDHRHFCGGALAMISLGRIVSGRVVRISRETLDLKLSGEAFPVEKTHLRERVGLFQENPALLNAQGYEVRTSVLPSVFKAFVQMVEGAPATVSRETVRPFQLLSKEFRFGALADECAAFSNGSLVSLPRSRAEFGQFARELRFWNERSGDYPMPMGDLTIVGRPMFDTWRASRRIVEVVNTIMGRTVLVNK